jgi:hypothetical protein
MLLNNNQIFNSNPGREIGGATDFKPFRKGGTNMNFYLNDIATNTGLRKSSFPSGYRPPSAWILSPKDGGLSSQLLDNVSSINFSNLAGFKCATLPSPLAGTSSINLQCLEGIGKIASDITTLSSIDADIAGLVEMVANLYINGTSSVDATMSLIAGMVADIIASATIDVDISGTVPLTADLIASSVLSVDITGNSFLVATIIADAILNGNIYAYGNMSSDLFVGAAVEELSPSSLAASLWNSLASQYNETGSFGNLINNLGAGANPWASLIEGSYTAEDILKILLSVAAGKTTITPGTGGTATVVFRDVNDNENRVIATMKGSKRTGVELNTD